MPIPEQTLYSALQNDPTISGMVALRVYPANEVQDTTMPLLTYQRISTTPFPVLSGTNGLLAARMQISAWGSTYGESKTLANAVYTALEGEPNMRFLNEMDRFDESVDLNFTVLDFTVWNTS